MNIQSIWPRNVGWLDVKLSDVEMNYLWDCCKDHRGNKKPDLAGNISNSQDIVDNDNWYKEVLECTVLCHLKENLFMCRLAAQLLILENSLFIATENRMRLLKAAAISQCAQLTSPLAAFAIFATSESENDFC